MKLDFSVSALAGREGEREPTTKKNKFCFTEATSGPMQSWGGLRGKKLLLPTVKHIFLPCIFLFQEPSRAHYGKMMILSDSSERSQDMIFDNSASSSFPPLYSQRRKYA